MSAAELRSLSEELSWHVGQTFTPGHQETFAQAAEIIELIAWAEEESNDVEIYQSPGKPRVIVGIRGGKTKLGPALLGTLRRAREAAR